MSSISDRLGVSKSELLDPTSSGAAVKQAHAETHIIQETRSYFTNNGVDLEAFKRGARRHGDFGQEFFIRYELRGIEETLRSAWAYS